MNFARPARFSLLLLGVALTLAGCETLDSAYSGTKDRLSRVNLPSFGRDGAPAPATPEQNADALIAAQAVDCPRVGAVDDLNSITLFAGNNTNKAGEEIARAHLVNIQSQCALKENKVIVDMDIIIDSTTGPRARIHHTDKPAFSFPYFIALTTPSGDIVTKEVFTANITFDTGETMMRHAENMRQVIPMNKSYYPSDYEILVGFQLSDVDLAHNRNLAAQGLAPVPTRVHSIRPANSVHAPALPADNVDAPAPLPEPESVPMIAPEPPPSLPAPQSAMPAGSLGTLVETPVSSGAFVTPDPVDAYAPAPAIAPPPAQPQQNLRVIPRIE